jgi:hypothetical protein
MFSLHAQGSRLCDGIPRREWLRIGGLSVLGLSLTDVLRGQALASGAPRSATFGRAKNVIYLWLQGGPPQHETFDPKPNAPAEIRGEFQPISTNVPGIQFCELLPRTSAIADKLAVVRSLHTDDNNHDVSGYWVLTGYPYGPGSARQIKPTDWPYMGSIIKMLKPSERLPALTSVWIPDMMRLNDNVQPAGQTAGFLGPHWEPERFVGDPSAANYAIEGLNLPPEIPTLRLSRRVDLLSQIEGHFRRLETGGAAADYDQISQHAFGLLTSGAAREAFDIEREPAAIRDRYGRHKWGQSVLLARRLIEAGVRLVHVNWIREPGDTAVNNPMWDTHNQNADRLQDFLCPQFDVGFTALMQDLDQRGLLDETLVVVIGEFGRTPKINANGGRDHWGPVFSFALAGAGIRGGQVYGASDKQGAYPAVDPLRPHDLTATIFHLLGIDHLGMFRDRADRPHRITQGEPIWRLLGDGPATTERTSPGGDVALVPPYDDGLLHDADFSRDAPLIPVGTATRAKGWRAAPVWQEAHPDDVAVKLVRGPAEDGQIVGRAWMGYGLGAGPAAGSPAGPIAQGTRLILTQPVRSPRAGGFTLSVKAAGGGGSAESYRELFLKHFICRLVFFGYTDLAKDPWKMREFAAVSFEPPYSADDWGASASFQLQRTLRDQDAGAGELSWGVGVAVIVEKTSPGTLDLANLVVPQRAFIRIEELRLTFNPRPRDDSVMA